MLRLMLAISIGMVGGEKLFYEMQPTLNDRIVCADNESKCPNNSTCCQLSAQWGCCPFQQATCCSDKVHCCPQDFLCNEAKGHCIKVKNNDTIPWVKKQPASTTVAPESTTSTTSIAIHVCPDTTTCNGAASCCRTYTGTYRCCTYPNDVCCSDGYSCCPRETICDQQNRRCITGFTSSKWKTMTPSLPLTSSKDPIQAGKRSPAMKVSDRRERSVLTDVKVVWCDAYFYCSNGQTCCKLPGNKWGCCNYSSATCCADSSYCCPSYKPHCTDPPGGCY